MRTPSSLASLGLAAIVGAGLGGAALAVLPRGGPSAEEEERAASMMRTAAEKGLADGRWRIVEPMWTREREFARDPRERDLVQIRLLDREAHNLLATPARELTRHLLGDMEQFLGSYPMVSVPVVEGVGPSRSISFEWRKGGPNDGPSRRAWFDAATGDLTRIVERDARGDVLRSLELVDRSLSNWAVRPLPTADAAFALSTRTRIPVDFTRFSTAVPFPLYEPAQLPPRFRRSAFGFDSRPPRTDAANGPLPLAWVAYSDGMLKMNLFVTTPANMRRLEDVARQQNTTAGPSGCPTSQADTPDELMNEAGSILVHRRDDGCRVVLRRDDLPDVAVILVGYRGLRSEDYVRTIRSLVRVVGKPPVAPSEPTAPTTQVGDPQKQK